MLAVVWRLDNAQSAIKLHRDLLDYKKSCDSNRTVGKRFPYEIMDLNGKNTLFRVLVLG